MRSLASDRSGHRSLAAASAHHGPLPLHITEYAHERLLNANDSTVARFFDLFHHRFLAFFYRAWAQAQPHVSRDRPDADPFADLTVAEPPGRLQDALAQRSFGF